MRLRESHSTATCLRRRRFKRNAPPPPIRDDVLVSISNRKMLASTDYPDKTKQWNKLSPASRNCYLWKPTYQEVYTTNIHEAEIWR